MTCVNRYEYSTNPSKVLDQTTTLPPSTRHDNTYDIVHCLTIVDFLCSVFGLKHSFGGPTVLTVEIDRLDGLASLDSLKNLNLAADVLTGLELRVIKH